MWSAGSKDVKVAHCTNDFRDIDLNGQVVYVSVI